MPTTTCAFCAQTLEIAFATTLVVIPPSADDESQTLYCHGACLIDRVHPSIPLHPGIDDA
jgi:hypothetical protein